MANTTQILDDGLQLDLSSLSLRAENSPAEPPSLQLLNPFQDLLDLHQDQDQIEAYLRQHLQPYLDGCQTLERLAPDNPFFQQVRDFWEKEGLEGNGLSNYIDLLCGILNFPPILLLNPSNWDRLALDDMISNSPTLSWLQDTLESFGFTLRDIVIIDMFPLLTDRKLNSIEEEERSRLCNEAFNLTVSFFRQFQTPVAISCQCSTRRGHARWDIVDHPLADQLSSSVYKARGRQVTRVRLDDQIIHVAQGFHPMHEYAKNVHIRLDLEQVLRGLLSALYEPCEDWRIRRRQHYEGEIDEAAKEVITRMTAFLDSITDYRRAQRRAASFGTVTPRLGHYSTPRWTDFKDKVRSFVDILLPVTS
ncbi:hypothetical protein PENNAL_c0117G07405 [Penicillium nalgiovense]|uniref:Uncharacterized protein n=1 Tax=Penicillium nalgiovense TaxID=60175 RepID=A0A1V6X5P6_PENNA|nr:hypothetical protein PENNAL_c0117G07405 [Penicillium nalgiovense]